MSHQKENLYVRDVTCLSGRIEKIDIYRILDAYAVSHPVGHAVKKLLVAGKRGAKSRHQDLEEAIASIRQELAASSTEQPGCTEPPQLPEQVEFGELVRKCRRAIGLSLAEPAAMLGITVSQMSLIERGRAPIPPAEQIKTLLSGLEESMGGKFYIRIQEFSKLKDAIWRLQARAGLLSRLSRLPKPPPESYDPERCSHPSTGTREGEIVPHCDWCRAAVPEDADEQPSE